jgi:MFS family permease
MHRDEVSSRWYKWAVVAMLWMICFFNYADRQGIFSVFKMLEDKEKGFGLNSFQLGVIGSAFMWVYAASGWFAGLVGDRFRRKSVILGGFLFWSVITLAFGFATKYWHLVALRAIEGLGEAFYFPAAMAMISAYHTPATRSRAMGLHQSSVYVGTIAGGTIAGVMGQYYGWRSSFFLFGGCGILVALLLLLLLKEPPREPLRESDLAAKREPRETVGGMLKGIGFLYGIPMVWILTLVFVGANFVAAIFLSWTPKFLGDKFGMSLALAGFSATFYLQLGSVVGVIAGGILADRLARYFRGGRMMAQTLGLFLGAPFIFIFSQTLETRTLVISMAFFGLFKGMYDSNIWASLHDVVPRERRATAVGVMNSIGWFGGASGTLLIGWAAPKFGMSACLSATSLIYIWFGLLLVIGIALFMRGRAEPATLALPDLGEAPAAIPKS